MTNKLNNPFKITELINAVNELDTNKQDTLISGTNIKTINGSNVLGNGDLTITADTNDCVHKTGNETITGVKTFNSEIYSTTDNTLNRTTTQGDASVRMFDWDSAVYTRLISINNNTSTPKETYLDVIAHQNGTTHINMVANEVGIVGSGDSAKLLLTNDYTTYNGFYLDRNDANALKLFNLTQGATAWSSVTALVAQSLSGNGYIKFNHGLMINWGIIGTGSNSQTITFSRAYSTIPNLFAGNNYNSTGSFPGFANQSTTGCTVYHNSGIAGWWLAVGY